MRFDVKLYTTEKTDQVMGVTRKLFINFSSSFFFFFFINFFLSLIKSIYNDKLQNIKENTRMTKHCNDKEIIRTEPKTHKLSITVENWNIIPQNPYRDVNVSVPEPYNELFSVTISLSNPTSNL